VPPRVRRSRYTVDRVYQMTCTDCNAYIDDNDFTTREAADEAIEEEFHSGDR